MKVKNKKYTTIWYDKNVVYIIDQTELPLRFRIEKLKNLKDFCDAISKMKVRGSTNWGDRSVWFCSVYMQ